MSRWFGFSRFFQQDFWILRRYRPLVTAIEQHYQKWIDWENATITAESKKIIADVRAQKLRGNSLIIRTFALAMLAIYRIYQIKLHSVQIYGALALHNGNVAEMKTGEGKTLTAILPAYLNSLLGHKIYIVTVNEYLVKRDADNNAPIFALLNLEVGHILATMSHDVKRSQYQKAVIYTSNSEIGFDYLRDNMRNIITSKMQGSFDFVIVDEIDSVLIDEGRTPLVISGKERNRSDYYLKVNQFVASLKTTDYQIDRESKQIFLSAAGVLKAQAFFVITNLFGIENSELLHFINNALYAHKLLIKNVDYLVKQQKIMLIDHFTGRILEGRTLSEGLHQAVEAKEICPIKKETNVLASITYQNFFRLFKKIAGMTGTAKMESEELREVYNMHVVSIPTNRPVIRADDYDRIYYSMRYKYVSLVADIQARHARGQPILIGTNALAVSEEIGKLLTKMQLPFKLLNAKRHEYEAKIVARAGHYKAITIATNMAGRGTDIQLDERAEAAGGLAVLGVARNDSRRIDLQLRGRSGRQGEPGYSCFYLSLDDALFRRFASPTIKRFFASLKDQPLRSRMLTRIIKRAQKQLTNSSYEQRKNVLEYDNIMSQQRTIIYLKRERIINYPDLTPYWATLATTFVHHHFEQFSFQYFHLNATNIARFRQIFVDLQVLPNNDLPLDSLLVHSSWKPLLEQFITYYQQIFHNLTTEQKQLFAPPIKMIMISTLDDLWSNYLDETNKIKATAFLQSYAQKQPLQAFIEQSEKLYAFLKIQFINRTIAQVIRLLNRYLN